MGEALSCSACEGETAARCSANLTEIRGCLDRNVESTLRGDWSEATVTDGDVELTPLDPFSAQAIDGTTIIRNLLTFSYIEDQRKFGCNLDEEQLRQKLTTT